MRTVFSRLAVAFWLALAARASAATPDAPAVSYRAPGACPSEETFVQRVRSRLASSRTAAGRGRRLDVRIEVIDGRYVGKLSLVEADGRSTTKSLDDVDCGGLVDALSLVAALALETDDVAPIPSIPPKCTPDLKHTCAPEPASASAPTPASAPVPAPAPASAGGSGSSSGAPSRIGLAVGGLGAVGPAPRPLFGAALALHWVQLGAGPFSPTLELGGAASLSPDAAEGKGTAIFAWLTARVAAYLVTWPLGAGVVLRGGGAADLGVLLARGHDTISPATSSRPWASLGLVAGLEVPLGARFALHSALGLEAPLRRDRYAFGSSDFFEVPVVIATGGVSVIAYVR